MQKVPSVIITVLVAVLVPMVALVVVGSSPVSSLLMDDALSQTTEDALERDYLMEVARAVRDFSFGNDDASLPEGEDYRTAITPDAVSHLVDVRGVFLTVQYACIGILLALVVLFALVARRYGARYLAWPLTIGGAIPLAAALILGIAAFLNFDAFFAWMHSLFFADGTWTFPVDSLLIRSLPYGFWASCAVVWVACMVLLCAISVVAGVLLGRRARQAQPASMRGTDD